MTFTTDLWIMLVAVAGVLGLYGIWATIAWGMTHTRKGGTDDSDAGDYGSIRSWIAREPVRFRAILVSIVGSVVTLLGALGFEVDPAVMSAGVGMIVAVAVGVAELGRRKVTPVDAPNVPIVTED